MSEIIKEIKRDFKTKNEWVFKNYTYQGKTIKTKRGKL